MYTHSSAAAQKAILPNNENILLTAHQAAELYDKSEVRVIESHDIGEGYATLTMLSYDSGDVEKIAGTMREAMEGVVTGLVTRAVRDAHLDGVRIHTGDYIGFAGKNMLCSDVDKAEAAMRLMDRLHAENHEVLIAIYGDSVKYDEKLRFREGAAAAYDLGECLPEDMEYVVANNKRSELFDVASTHMLLVDASLPAKTVCTMTGEMEQVDGVKYVLGLESLVGAEIPEAMIPASIREILKSDRWELLLAIRWMIDHMIRMARAYGETLPEIAYTVAIEHLYPLVDDDEEERERDLSEVARQARSRRSYISKWHQSDDPDAELAQIKAERQLLEDTWADGLV